MPETPSDLPAVGAVPAVPAVPAPPAGAELLGAPFHIGLVVRQLEPAMALLGAALGRSWAKVRQAQYAYTTADGPVPTKHRYTYSMGPVPHIELIEGEAGSIWEPRADIELHHLGYWADDLAATAAAVAAAGLPVEATLGPTLDTPKLFTYHRPPGATVWVELVDSRLREAFAPWLAGGDMGDTSAVRR
jgi:hypothetical protein